MKFEIVSLFFFFSLQLMRDGMSFNPLCFGKQACYQRISYKTVSCMVGLFMPHSVTKNLLKFVLKNISSIEINGFPPFFYIKRNSVQVEFCFSSLKLRVLKGWATSSKTWKTFLNYYKFLLLVVPCLFAKNWVKLRVTSRVKIERETEKYIRIWGS